MFQKIDEKRRNDDVCNLPHGIIEEVSNPMDISKEEKMTYDEFGRKHYKTPNLGFYYFGLFINYTLLHKSDCLIWPQKATD